MLKIKNKIPSALTIGGKIVERVLMRNEVVWGRVQTPLYIQNTYNGSNTVTIKQTLSGSPDSSTYAKHLQFSKNGLNWTTITLSSTAYTITLNKGEKVYFRGNEGVFNYWYSGGKKKAITTISANQTHTVGGNINTLLDYQDPYGLTLPQGAFNSIFENNTKLTSASDITFTPSVDGSLPAFCYLYLFKKCTNLTTVPKIIPAKKQGQDSCNGMFQYTAITTAPALPATILANGCYIDTFHGCSKLVNPPELPATTLKTNCYRALFARCTSLVNAPELPATTLADGCYRELFYGCTSLINPPELPAKTLTTRCYQAAFEGCTSLKVAPQLPATVLADYCYQALFKGCSALTTPPTVIPAETAPYMCSHRMFNDCVSLKSAPELSPTTLGSGAYQYMFMGCSNLQTAPSELPAETLALNSYYEMFRGCSQLTTSPIIKAKTFAENSCRGMFVSCSKLNNVTVYADDISATNCTSSWLSGVASEGIFTNYGSATYTANSPSGIPTGWVENKNEYFYIENKYNGTNKIYLKTQTIYSQPDTGEFAKTIQYSKDKKTWTTIDLNYEYTVGNIQGTTVTNLTLSLNTGEKVYFRNDNGYFCYMDSLIDRHSHMFSSDENIKVGGNIKSLLNYKDMNGTKLKKGCFNNMFSGAKYLSDAKNLILSDTNLASCCYYSLFENCHSLTNAPVLPATNLASHCYESMFSNTALTTAPKLPATKLAPSCYSNLFGYCYSLTSAPALPATTMAISSYNSMFYYCKSLTTAPELPATTLALGCYMSMFKNCYALTSAPALPATKLASRCYVSIFENCSKINSLIVYANDNSASNCITGWLSNVASEGTFHNLGTATYETDSPSGIPTGWTEVKN